MLKRISFMLFIAAGLQLLSGCSGCNQNQGSDDLKMPDSLANDAPLQLSEELIGDVVQNISSPVEMAALIKSTGVEFSQRILNNPDRVTDYNTSFKRALNLGVYSADLGYINMFDKSSIVINYLLAVKNMADGIKVGQFFDFTALKRLAQNSSNLDSLMEISVSSMNKMDSYLREQKRSNVSSLIVAGAWIEGLYIASNVVEQTHNRELTDRILEQKDIVDILLIILNNFSSDEKFANLAEKMSALKDAYLNVKITTEVGEPKSMEKDGMLIIVQDEISHIEASPETLQSIINEIKEIRKTIVE
ncbi:MAG: hypothetical protein JW717_09845 [Marinilabiliaceae bacterium]|nr:hypothetical protein [Marinilabiliaceae bacterium]